MTDFKTPANPPAGDIDDAALVEATAIAFAKAWRDDIRTYLDMTVVSWSEMGEWQREAMRRCARAALATIRPTIEAQARRKALDDAERTASDLYGCPELVIRDAIRALKDKP